MKKMLVTGGTGFLGSSFIKTFHSSFEFYVLHRENSNFHRLNEIKDKLFLFDLSKNKISDIIKTISPDIIIHFATDYGRGNKSDIEIIEANLILPLTILSSLPNPSKTIFINTDTFLNKGINSYSLSKNQFLDWLKVYSKKIKCVNVVLEHFYGPGDNDTKFVTFILKKLIYNEQEIDLTEGIQKRDFIYIEDVVDAFKIIVDGVNIGEGFEDFFVCTKNTITIRSFVESMKHIFGNSDTKLNFGKIAYRENEVMDVDMDNSKLISMGWKPKYDIINGLIKTIAEEQKTNQKR